MWTNDIAYKVSLICHFIGPKPPDWTKNPQRVEVHPPVPGPRPGSVAQCPRPVRGMPIAWAIRPVVVRTYKWSAFIGLFSMPVQVASQATATCHLSPLGHVTNMARATATCLPLRSHFDLHKPKKGPIFHHFHHSSSIQRHSFFFIQRPRTYAHKTGRRRYNCTTTGAPKVLKPETLRPLCSFIPSFGPLNMFKIYACVLWQCEQLRCYTNYLARGQDTCGVRKACLPRLATNEPG